MHKPRVILRAAVVAAGFLATLADYAAQAEPVLRFAEPVQLVGSGSFVFDVDLVSAPEFSSRMTLEIATRQIRPPHQINFSFAAPNLAIESATVSSQEDTLVLAGPTVGGTPQGATLGYRPEAGEGVFTLDLFLQSPLTAGQSVDLTFETLFNSAPDGFRETLAESVTLIAVDDIQQITVDSTSDDIAAGKAAELLRGRKLELLDGKTTDKLATLKDSLLELTDGREHRLKDPGKLKGDVKIGADAKLILEKLQQVKLLGAVEITGGTLVAANGVQLGSDAARAAARRALQEEMLDEGQSRHDEMIERFEDYIDQFGPQFDPDAPPLSPEELLELARKQQALLQAMSNLSKLLHDTALSLIQKHKAGSAIEGDLVLTESLSVGDVGAIASFDVIGDFTVESSGALSFDLGGALAGQYDAIDVAGTFKLETGALLEVLLAGSPTPFEPQPGDVFDLVVADAIELQPFVLKAPTVDGLMMGVFVADVGGRQALRLGALAIPEPAAATLALALLPAAARLRRRQARRAEHDALCRRGVAMGGLNWRRTDGPRGCGAGLPAALVFSCLHEGHA